MHSGRGSPSYLGTSTTDQQYQNYTESLLFLSICRILNTKLHNTKLPQTKQSHYTGFYMGKYVKHYFITRSLFS